MMCVPHTSTFFFFNDTATTEIYTLSLHDALPICVRIGHEISGQRHESWVCDDCPTWKAPDRKSTRLNSSHLVISYAVFCLKKKKASKPFSAVSSGRSRSLSACRATTPCRSSVCCD